MRQSARGTSAYARQAPATPQQRAASRPPPPHPARPPARARCLQANKIEGKIKGYPIKSGLEQMESLCDWCQHNILRARLRARTPSSTAPRSLSHLLTAPVRAKSQYDGETTVLGPPKGRDTSVGTTLYCRRPRGHTHVCCAPLSLRYLKTQEHHDIGFFQIGGGIAGDYSVCSVPLIRQVRGRTGY